MKKSNLSEPYAGMKCSEKNKYDEKIIFHFYNLLYPGFDGAKKC